MGSAITEITFPSFLTGRERYNPLYYIHMRIMEEIRFFFFDVEDPAHNQKLCEMMRNIENKVFGLRRK